MANADERGAPNRPASSRRAAAGTPGEVMENHVSLAIVRVGTRKSSAPAEE